MKVCPTNGINPTFVEAGIAGFWTPRLIMTQGYCDYTCTLCGSVCPTGAIQEIKVNEKIKQPIKIGSAYIDSGRCLPWSGNAPCIVCQEVCPTSPKAIYLRDGRVVVRFDSADTQEEAGTLFRSRFDSDSNVALTFAPRLPDWMRSLGL